MKKTLLVFSLALLFSEAMAGGWTKSKGEGYFKLGQTVIRSSQFYEADGSIIDIFTTSVYITSIYGEYGLSDRVTGIVYVPLLSRITVNNVEFTSGRTQEGDAYNSLGDSDIGLKFGLIQGKPFVLSTTVMLGIPLGGTAGGRSQALQTGDGEFNQLVKLEAGYGFNKPFYVTGGIGFNNRTKGFSEEFRYEFEAGYTYKKNLLLSFKLAGVKSFKNGDANGSMNGIFSNNTEFLAVGPEIAYSFSEKFGFALSASGALYGQRILAAPSYGAGLYIKF